jgi:hypothetical protein
VKFDSRFPFNETENAFSPFPSLFLLTHQKKGTSRERERRGKIFFLYVPKIKMKEKRNDSITRQISLNKQFVLPSFESMARKGMKSRKHGDRKRERG